ncbi:MAG: hypothetical protein WBM96_06745, partial [Polyangiales bacterium]
MQPLKATLGFGAREYEVTPQAPNVGLAQWLRQVCAGVDERLLVFFEEKRRETREISSPTLELVDEIEALTMRGGKR